MEAQVGSDFLMAVLSDLNSLWFGFLVGMVLLLFYARFVEREFDKKDIEISNLKRTIEHYRKTMFVWREGDVSMDVARERIRAHAEVVKEHERKCGTKRSLERNLD